MMTPTSSATFPSAIPVPIICARVTSCASLTPAKSTIRSRCEITWFVCQFDYCRTTTIMFHHFPTFNGLIVLIIFSETSQYLLYIYIYHKLSLIMFTCIMPQLPLFPWCIYSIYRYICIYVAFCYPHDLPIIFSLHSYIHIISLYPKQWRHFCWFKCAVLMDMIYNGKVILGTIRIVIDTM